MTESIRDREERAAEEARRWIARMASGDMSPDELEKFRAWRVGEPLHDRAFGEARAVWRAAGGGPDGRALPSADHRPRPHLPSFFGQPIRRIAVTGAALAVVAGLVWGDELSVLLRADHRTGTLVESITLADGSRAMLDAGTAITISYDGKERRIELLRGDAWFDVAHGDQRPFRVAALGGETQDVGTAFEVRREDGAVSVAVSQGAVEIRSPSDGRGLLLRTSERARYAQGAPPIRIGHAAPDTIAAWRQGEILFDRTDARAAISRIGRYRAGPVFILGALAHSRRVSGAFRVDRPDEAIDAIAGMSGLSVSRIGGIAVLRPVD
ncbi:MAG: FecR domain-containing protein [Sphingomonas phyllosphaerae]|uniref:FecR family protein n=1 Tax=Sphingomonas phyllosphaerae TaxID=257003 RepID=UPI002FFCC210